MHKYTHSHARTHARTHTHRMEALETEDMAGSIRRYLLGGVRFDPNLTFDHGRLHPVLNLPGGGVFVDPVWPSDHLTI